MKKELEAFDRLLTIIAELREKCPWDRKQTIQSLRYLTIEETYELADAIIDEDMPEIQKELGDLIMHVVFYAQIAKQQQAFDIADVLQGICDKLVHRHPHIYGDVEVADEEEVKRNWELIKLKEGKKSVLEGVPKSLPAVVKANRIQEKVKGVGFDWENAEQVREKLTEELQELDEAVAADEPKGRVEEEIGDLMFSVINYARFVGVNPEDALEKTNRKFIKRFQYLEESAAKAERSLSEMSLAEMDEIWQQSKVRT